MRKVILLVLTVLIFLAGRPAHAVDLKDCSKGTTKARLACLQANTVLLNSSYQTVAAELRKAVVDFHNQITDVNGQITVLNGKLKDLNDKVDKIPPIPDLSDVVRRSQPIKLGFDSAHCFAFPTGVTGQVAGTNPTIDIQKFVLFQDCQGSPPLGFH